MSDEVVLLLCDTFVCMKPFPNVARNRHAPLLEVSLFDDVYTTQLAWNCFALLSCFTRIFALISMTVWLFVYMHRMAQPRFSLVRR